MASTPSSWKTLFKFLLEECFQKATLQMSWCTPSLAKPQISFSFPHLAEPAQSSRNGAQKTVISDQEFHWKAERKVGVPWKARAGVGWPPEHSLSRKSYCASPSTFLSQEVQRGPCNLSLRSWRPSKTLLFPVQVGGTRQQWPNPRRPVEITVFCLNLSCVCPSCQSQCTPSPLHLPSSLPPPPTNERLGSGGCGHV